MLIVNILLIYLTFDKYRKSACVYMTPMWLDIHKFISFFCV